jgi:hypothetical protein
MASERFWSEHSELEGVLQPIPKSEETQKGPQVRVFSTLVSSDKKKGKNERERGKGREEGRGGKGREGEGREEKKNGCCSRL